MIPVLVYPDVRTAVAWLEAAFGFSERLQIGEDHRSQMDVPGGGAVILADIRDHRRPPRPEESSASVIVRVDDVDAHLARARAHGVEILDEPRDHMYGERQYTARDLAGHQWTFSQTLTDVDPADWGGQLKQG